jgi:hypothetical protein
MHVAGPRHQALGPSPLHSARNVTAFGLAVSDGAFARVGGLDQALDLGGPQFLVGESRDEAR